MPEIPVGDMVRKLKLPGWLRWVMNLVKGMRIKKGNVEIVLDEKPSMDALLQNRPSMGDLNQPHKVAPPRDPL